jgi:hypothetical protein
MAANSDGVTMIRELAMDPVQVVDLNTTEDQRYLTRVPDGTDALKVQVWLARGPVPENR